MRTGSGRSDLSRPRLASSDRNLVVVFGAPEYAAPIGLRSFDADGYRSAAFDDLANRTGAKLVVHGHHYRSYEARLGDGTHVRGLGMAEPWLVRR